MHDVSILGVAMSALLPQSGFTNFGFKILLPENRPVLVFLASAR